MPGSWREAERCIGEQWHVADGVVHRRQIAKWNRTKGAADPEHYKRHILPKLQSIPVPEIVRATGMTYPYCSEIKHGRRIPHPRWWERLGEF